MITEFKLFENQKYDYQIGDIVYCIELPQAGVFYKNRPYEIILFTEDNEHIQVKDMKTGKDVKYWSVKDRFISELEYNANKYNV